MVIGLVEVQPSQIMEKALIMPESGHEAEWAKLHAKELALVK
jgi:hypothetical protein